MADVTSYRALALQIRCDAVNGAGPDEAREVMLRTIGRVRTAVTASKAFIGTDLRLVVLPEYLLTGHPLGEPVDAWATLAGIDAQGAEYEALGVVAAGAEIFLAGNAYERDPHFPGLYFQACFVIAPSGDVVLRYRRINSLFTPTPHDVWDRYLEHYGIDGVFPVARTDIGTLACIASDEILFPEVARCLAMRGAEVFCHSTSEAGSPGVTVKDVAKRARAFENTAYVVSANTAGIAGSPIPGASTDGKSQIVSHDGAVLAEAGFGESMVAYAEVDLAALRRARRRPGMANLLARNRFDAYASSYAQARFAEANGLGDGKVPERGWFAGAQAAVIERLIADGVIR